MKNNITFCIASANNEKEYTKLLIKSLRDHTDINRHEILIFIDSDNQNTYEELLEIKKELPNLKIYRNTGQYPIGSQRNVSLLFHAATNDIVCYLQSDMVVGPNFDTNILKNMKDESVVLCMARIEPPLHPPGPEKIVKNFGLTPEEFQYEEFVKFVLELQTNPKPNIEGHFAPFAVYKKTWFEKIGGFDTQFRCSREDSDMILRMYILGLNMVESWEACVYHFTCVSSRGKDWFKPETDKQIERKNQLQVFADREELKRFIRKWGGDYTEDHKARPLYDIALFLDIKTFVRFDLLSFLEIYVQNLYLNDVNVAEELKRRTVFDYDYYSNLRWNYSKEHWESVKYLFNNQIQNRIRYSEDLSNIYHDVNIYANYFDLEKNCDQTLQNFIMSLNHFIHEKPIGTYEIGPLTIQINQKNELSHTYGTNKNIELVLKDANQFVFE